MDGQELTALGERLKRVLCEYVPAESVTAMVGFYPDSDVLILSFHITAPGGYQVAKAEVRRG